MENLGKPENSNIVNLGEKRREKQNIKRRTKTEVSPDGYFLYPQEMVGITLDEALVIADDVVKKYSNPDILYDDFFNKEAVRLYGSDLTSALNLLTEKSKEVVMGEMEESLSSQKTIVKTLTTENLVNMLASHKKDPTNYYGTVILAVSEELINRLGGTA